MSSTDPNEAQEKLKRSLKRIRKIVLRGTFDRLSDRTDDLSALSSWLRRTPVPSIADWPSDAELAQATPYFETLALLREVGVQRPGLVDLALIQSPPIKAIGPNDFELPTGELTVKLVDERVEFFAQLVLCDLWSVMQRYEMLATPREVIQNVLEEIVRIDLLVSTVESQFLRQYEKLRQERPTLLIGIKALTRLQRGRLSRAIAEDSADEAKRRLTNALELYELRIAAREDNTSTPIKFSRHRSANALLALSYLHAIRAKPHTSAALLKTAKLLAVSAEDSVLKTELDIVEYTIRRLQLSRPPSKESETQREEEKIRRGLETCVEYDHEQKRPYFEAVSRFQLAQLHADNVAGAAVSRSAALKHADEIIVIGEKSASRFWEASAFLLKARIFLGEARQLNGGSSGDNAVNLARGELARANRLIVAYNDLRTLRADHKIYEAQCDLLNGRLDSARQLLHSRNVATRSVGLTTIPSRIAVVRLLRIELEIRQKDFGSAWTQLARFERTDLKRLEIGWIRDEYYRMRNLAHDRTKVFVLTDEILAEDMKLDAAQRRFTYARLMHSAEQFLVAATARINQNLLPNDTQLATAWGVADRKMAARIRKRAQQVEGGSSKSRAAARHAAK